MNLGDILQTLTGGVKTPDKTTATSGTVSAGERNYHAINDNRNMAPGQTIQGEVVAKDGNTVQIAIDANTVLTARLEHDINIALGQNLSFEVRSNNGSLLSLTPLYANMANEATIMKALSAAGLSATPENMQMVSDMMKEGLSIDKDTIAYVNRQLVDFPSADSGSIMQMIRLGLPISEESIGQFELYKNNAGQILESIKDIAAEIPQTYMELIAEGKDTEAVAFYERIIKALTGGEAGAEAVNEDGAFMQKLTEGGAGGNGTGELTDGVNGEQNKNGAQNPSVIDGNGSEAVDKAILEALKENAESDAKGNMPGTAVGGDMAGSGSTSLSGNILNTVSGENDGAGILTQNSLSKETWRELGSLLERLGVDKETAQQISDGKLTPKEVLTQINEQIAQSAHVFKEGFSENLKELFGSRPFQNLLNAQLSDQWLLKPEEVAYKENVEQLYERIREQSARISEAFQMADKADGAGAKSLDNMQNNLDFMNQMNSLFTYVQLPLKMAGNETHGDLYVYTNKKSLAQKDGTVSALLHLDMENLGPMDVYVTMDTARNKVNTNFTLKDEEALDLIAKNIHILDERLEKRGYKMKADFKLKEDESEETNIMDEIIKQSKNISVLSHTSFDMRA